jgi:predicted metalloprotease with PDZ domain
MRARRRGAAPALAAGLALVLSATSLRGESLTYVLTPKFDAGVLDVEIDWQTEGRTHSVLGIPERVGPVQNVPGLLRNVLIDGAKSRREGALWTLEHRAGASIHCRYQVAPPAKAFEQWNYTHLPITTATIFHGLGGAFLLTPQRASGMPAEYETVLRWQLPAGQTAVCSWGPGRTIGQRIRVEDLRTAVYLAGKLKTQRVEADGRRITVAAAGDVGFSAEEFAELSNAIIGAQCDFMHERAFPEFVVTAIAAGPPLKPGESRLAGTGLHNSFAMWIAPGSKLNDAVEHLFAHELFHYWNGRMLPSAEPERLQYWFVEGLTDYYALRILRESGRWDVATYAKWINRHLRAYALNPAQNATNEQIEREYWEQRDTVGEVAYQRGLLLGLRWHKLASDRKVPGGLDKLLLALVERGRRGGFELTNAGVRQAGNELLGSWFGPEFDRFVTRAETLDVPPDALAPELTGRRRVVHAFELGFDRARSLKDKQVRGLVKGGVADRAGVREKDELVGWRIPPDADSEVVLQIRRGAETVTITYAPRGAERVALEFVPAGGAAPDRAATDADASGGRP